MTLDGNQSAEALVFDASDSNGYTLSPGTGGVLTLGTSAGASIAVVSGTNTISAPLVLAGSLACRPIDGCVLESLRQRRPGHGRIGGAHSERRRSS